MLQLPRGESGYYVYVSFIGGSIMKNLILLLSVLLLLIACGNNAASGSGSSNVSAADASPQLLEPISTIPTNGVGYALLVAYNPSNEPIYFSNAQITLHGQKIETGSVNNIVDFSQAQQINPGEVAYIKITPPSKNGSFILQVDYVWDSGKNISDQVVVNYSDQLATYHGYIYDGSNLNFSVLPNSVIHVAIPIYLTQILANLATVSSDPKVKSNLVCPNPKVVGGTLCTLILQGEPTSQLLSTDIQFVGRVSSERFDIAGSTGINVTLTPDNSGNLIASTRVNITPSSPNPMVSFYNNGGSTISNLVFSQNSPSAITISGSTCGSTLAAGASCSFTISSSANTSFSGSLIANYTTTSSTSKNLTIGVSYVASTASPSLSITAYGSFTQVINNYVTIPVFVTNTGNVTLTNLKFGSWSNIPGASNLSLDYGCNLNGQSLSPAQSCTFYVGYLPTSIGSGVGTIAIQGRYSDTTSNSNNLSYMAYSSQSWRVINGYTFTLVGEYGSILTSSNPINAASWTLPQSLTYNSGSVIGTGIVESNSGNYLIADSVGGIHQSQFDSLLLWSKKTSPTVTTNGLVGVAYDTTNKYYYTIASAANIALQYSNNLNGAWSTNGTTGGSNTPTGIFLLNGFVFATISNPTNGGTGGGRVACATAGVSGPSTTFANVTNSKYGNGNTPANFAMYYYNSTYYAFGSKGSYATTNSATPCTATWTTSGSIGPNSADNRAVAASSAVSGSVMVVGRSDGAIYFTTNGSTWITANSPTTNKINGMTYGTPAGFVAVGNNATIVTSPTGLASTWSVVPAINIPTAANLTYAYYDSGESLYIALGQGVILQSGDGVIWKIPALRAVTYNNASYVVGGDRGRIYIASSLSGSFASTTMGGDRRGVRGISCPASNLCLAVGESGLVASSTDMATWAVQSVGAVGTTQNLNGVTYVSPNNIIVGNNGTILVSSSGTSWASKTSGTTNNLTSVSGHGNNVYAVGGSTPTIIYSLDTGNTWINQATGLPYLVGASSVYAGDQGGVIVGNNGGAAYGSYLSWNDISTGVSANLYGVNGLGSQLVATGASATVIVSSFAGLSWTSITLPASISASVTFANMYGVGVN